VAVNPWFENNAINANNEFPASSHRLEILFGPPPKAVLSQILLSLA
jgi:hypothetical protein